MSALADERAALEQALETMRGDVERLEHEATTERGRVQQLLSELERARATAAEHHAHRAALDEKSRTTAARVEELEARSRDEQAAMEAVVSRAGSLNDEAAGLRQERQRLAHESDALKQELLEQRRARLELEERIAAADVERERLSAVLTTAQTASETRIAQLDEELRSLKSGMGQMTTRERALAAELDATRFEAARLGDDLAPRERCAWALRSRARSRPHGIEGGARRPRGGTGVDNRARSPSSKRRLERRSRPSSRCEASWIRHSSVTRACVPTSTRRSSASRTSAPSSTRRSSANRRFARISTRLRRASSRCAARPSPSHSPGSRPKPGSRRRVRGSPSSSRRSPMPRRVTTRRRTQLSQAQGREQWLQNELAAAASARTDLEAQVAQGLQREQQLQQDLSAAIAARGDLDGQLANAIARVQQLEACSERPGRRRWRRSRASWQPAASKRRSCATISTRESETRGRLEADLEARSFDLGALRASADADREVFQARIAELEGEPSAAREREESLSDSRGSS